MRYLDALNYGNKLLKLNKIDSSVLDSEILLAKVLKLTREKVIINSERKINKKNFDKFKSYINRRKKKEPVAYIFRRKEFWKNDFIVNRNVLIPRPETEHIVEQVLKLTNFNSSKTLLDIGTGSGCIILSILKERPKCFGTAIDISKNALKVAYFNAKMHHLENKIKFINIDIDKFNLSKYDFIISNPPYINCIDLSRLDISIKEYEPIVALKAGIDGLSETKKIIKKSKNLLKNNGKLIIEIGNNQLNGVINMLKKNNFYINKVCKDIQSYPRVIVSTKIF